MKDFINKNKKVIMILGIVIILSGIGFAVAYTMNAINVAITTGEYGVVYTGTATLPSSKLEPVVDSAVLSSTEKIFKIDFTVKGASTNPTNKNIIYDVSLTNLNIPPSARSEHLKWMLYKNGTKISEGNFSNNFDLLINNRMVLTNTQQDLPSYSSTADSYIFYMWISEACTSSDITTCTTDMDVSGITDKTISGEIRIELLTGSKKTLSRPASPYKGILINNVPSQSGQYNVDTSNCTDVSVTYNYADKSFEISNVAVGEFATCSPIITKTTRKNLASYIKDDLTGTTQGNGQVVNENGYRYEGKNPNNYVLFNNELWRIIGVFDQTSHGQTGQYLTKIIREEPIGGLAWDKSGTNNWATSSLYNLLNTHYYNAEDGTDSGYCYGYSSITTNCDYTISGIQEEYRDMVKNVIWYLGGYSSYSVTTNNMYTYERSSDDTYYYTNNTSNKTTTGNIGLMYESDYGYSVLSSSCARTTELRSYSTNACAGNSWLYGNGFEWTIGHNTSSSNNVFYVNSPGGVYNDYANYGYATHPVLYLNSLVYIINGTGSKSDPYVIGM